MGLAIHGDADHLIRRRHFEVELALDDFAQEAQVAILDVAAIFPQMDDDAIRSAQFRQHRGGDGLRLFAPACLAQGRHVIYVDAQPSHGCSSCGAVCSPAAIMANQGGGRKGYTISLDMVETPMKRATAPVSANQKPRRSIVTR